MTSTENLLRTALPNLYGKDGQRRPDVERRLAANIRRGSIFSASLNPDRKTYRVVTASGTEFTKVTLAEADMLCSVAISAFGQGRAER